MKRKALKHISFVDKQILTIESRVDKLGNQFLCVSYGENDYVCFEKMSSVLDFINTNFNINPFKIAEL